MTGFGWVGLDVGNDMYNRAFGTGCRWVDFWLCAWRKLIRLTAMEKWGVGIIMLIFFMINVYV